MKKRYFCIDDFYDETGGFRLTDQGAKNLMTLSEIVMNSHYSYAVAEKEDLKSVGVFKALELLQSGSFDPTRSSLKNYLYTGMRNEMKNYLYKNGRDVAVEDEVLIGMNGTETTVDEEMTDSIIISDAEIRLALGRLYNQEVDSKVKATLNHMGFVTSSREIRRYVEVYKEVALVIWMKQK